MKPGTLDAVVYRNAIVWMLVDGFGTKTTGHENVPVTPAGPEDRMNVLSGLINRLQAAEGPLTIAMVESDVAI